MRTVLYNPCPKRGGPMRCSIAARNELANMPGQKPPLRKIDPSFLELACESLRVEIGQKISDARRVVKVEMNLPVAVVE